jgi:hypothetical protein
LQTERTGTAKGNNIHDETISQLNKILQGYEVSRGHSEGEERALYPLILLVSLTHFSISPPHCSQGLWHRDKRETDQTQGYRSGSGHKASPILHQKTTRKNPESDSGSRLSPATTVLRMKKRAIISHGY